MNRTYYENGGIKSDIVLENQGPEYRTLVHKYFDNGSTAALVRYKNNILDGGIKPAIQQWNRSGELIKCCWYTDGMMTRDELADPAETALEKMNPREDCVGIICAAAFIAGLITMLGMVCSNLDIY